MKKMIVKWKRSNQHWIHSKQYYDSLTMNNPDAICTYDRKGDLLSTNPAFTRITGYGLEEMRKIGYLSIVVQNDLEKRLEHTHKGIQGIPQEYELAIIHKHGNQVDLSVKIIPIIINDEIVGYSEVSKDITILKQTQEVLQKHEKNLRMIIDVMPDFINLKDGNGRWIEANEEAQRIFEFENDSFIGKTDQELAEASPFYGEALRRCMESDRLAWEAREITCCEETIPLRNGQHKIYHAIKIPVFNHNGEPNGLLVIGRDITDQKRAEAELRLIKEQLESFVNNCADAIVVYDLHGNIVQANPATFDIYGWSIDELIGQKPPEIPADIAAEAEQLYEIARKGGQVKGFETVRHRKDGSLFDVSLTLSPLRDNKGNIMGYAGTARDITNRKRTEELLRRSDKLSVIGQLAAGVAHEVRNPLTTIRGFIQLLEKQIEDRYYLDIILKELDRINFIVSEFLVLAKPQAVNYKPNNLQTMLQNTVAFLEMQAIINNVRIYSDFDEEVSLVNCEENQIKQVIINILKNAIEVMPNGGEILIQLKKADSNHIRIGICDQGPGIAKDRLLKLGEPFFTTKENGTGLGLMVSYKIIEDHGGKISIDSEWGKGTNVYITLPLASNK